jgi:uncharacterized protein YutE (UPF0331/DUF86 family)
MPEIDIKRVLDKIRVIEDSLSKLKTLAQLSLDEFISDFKYFDSAKYNLQTAIEAMIDIGNHIISRRGLGIPKTYADTFEILQKSGIIAKKDAECLIPSSPPKKSSPCLFGTLGINIPIK